MKKFTDIYLSGSVSVLIIDPSSGLGAVKFFAARGETYDNLSITLQPGAQAEVARSLVNAAPDMTVSLPTGLDYSYAFGVADGLPVINVTVDGQVMATLPVNNAGQSPNIQIGNGEVTKLQVDGTTGEVVEASFPIDPTTIITDGFTNETVVSYVDLGLNNVATVASDNEAIATVADGESGITITSVAEGTTIITVTNEAGNVATVAVVVAGDGNFTSTVVVAYEVDPAREITIVDFTLDGQGSFTSHKYIDAGDASYNFIDSFEQGNWVVINNFGTDDQITLQGVDETAINNGGISSTNDDNVFITMNNKGVVSQIELVGVANGSMIYDLASFNALNIGDIVIA